MARKRKATCGTRRSQTVIGRPALQNLQAIGLKLGHPVMFLDVCDSSKNKQPAGEVPLVFRQMSFHSIPACCLGAKGNGANWQLADESAAHAMLDFFRLAISPEFVGHLQACADDEAVNTLIATWPQLKNIFDQFEKAIAADFLCVSRCSQLEITAPFALRGKEVKKRVLMNLKDPSIGYGNMSPPPKTSTPAPKAPKPPKPPKPSGNPSEIEEITIDDGDSGDEIQIIAEFEKKPGTETSPEKTPKSPKSPQKSASSTPKPKSPITYVTPKEVSPEVEEFRATDALNERRLQIKNNLIHKEHRAYSHIDSSTYFGTPNTSESGPPEVICSIPNAMNRSMQYEEAQSSDESEDDEEVPRKRAKMADEDVVVHMTSSSSSTAAVIDSDSPSVSEGKEDTPEPKVSETDDEIGDIVDEWNEDDSGREENTSNDVTTTTTPLPAEAPPTSSTASTENGYWNGLSNHHEFIKSQKLPFNYQTRTCGVVVNEKLCRQVEEYVESVIEKQFESVKQVSRLTWMHYRQNIQDEDVYRIKMKAREMLNSEFQKIFPEKTIALHVTGSTVNGCGSYNSDMDMCLCYPVGYTGSTIDDYVADRSHSSKILRKLDKTMKRSKWGQSLKRIIARSKLIPAKVPIIKCDLTREFRSIDVDINVNNIAGIYNSHLTHYYSLIDYRFPAIALLVKHWAVTSGVGNAPDGYMNSYSLILLVIHYLQCGVSPAVLPNLQFIFPERFDRKLPIDQLILFGDLVKQIPPSPPNTWSVGELVIGFFYYYSNFDFQNQAISIRSAQVIQRNLLPRDTANYPIFIEEPFDAVNTARSVRTQGHMNEIKREFQKVCKAFSSKRRFNLEEIGVNVVEVP